MSAKVGSTVLFDGEPCAGGDVGAGDVDIKRLGKGLFGDSYR